MDELTKALIDDKAALGIVVTIIAGFIAWLVKSLIESPLNNSKEAFYNILNKRVEMMSQLKAHLTLICFFPGKSSFKHDLQKILLDGNTAYVDSDILASAFKITLSEHTDLKLARQLVTQIDDDLKKWISIASDDISFYKKYNSPNPSKRILALFSLSFWSLLFIIAYITIIITALYVLFFSNYKLIGGIAIMIIVIAYYLKTKKNIKSH